MIFMKVLEQYKNTLLPIYEEMCGDTRSYDEVAAKFDAFINAPERSLLLALTVSSAPARTAFFTNFFKEFLQKEENCGQSSFMAWANNAAIISVHPTAQQDAATVAWKFINVQYATEIHELLKLLTAAPEPDRADEKLKRMILIRARRASILSSKIKFVLDLKEASQTDPVDAAILTAESGSLRDNFHDYTEQVIMNVPSIVTVVRRPQLNLQITSQLLQTNWLEFANPIQWVNNSFSRWFNKMATGLDIVRTGVIPDAEFIDPGTDIIRALIYKIIEVAARIGKEQIMPAKKSSVRMNFEFNESSYELIVSATELIHIISDEAWLKVKEILVKMGVESRVRVYPSMKEPRSINIPLWTRSSPSSNSPDSMDGPTGRFDTGGRLRFAPAGEQNYAALPHYPYAPVPYFFVGGMMSMPLAAPYLMPMPQIF